MLHELETLVSNLVVALSKKDLSKYPVLTVYRHHMTLNIDPDDQLHELFENLDFDNAELADLLLCSGTEVVRLHDKLIGLKINEFDPSAPTAIYWLSKKEDCTHTEMNGLYDSVKTFLDSIPEEGRPGQRIALGDCGGLIPWRSVQHHIVNNPRDIVLGCLNHPHRFFTPSAGLYVKMKDAKDTEVYPSLDYISLSDLQSEEPVWFTVGKTVRNTIVL